MKLRDIVAAMRFAVAALFVLALSGRAHAQRPEIDRARASFEETAFEDALATLDAVQDDAGFERADVIAWLVLRARVASALGDAAQANRELVRLARLVREVALPPDLRARFDALASTVEPLDVELRWVDGALEAVTDVDDPGLVRDVRVHAVVEGVEQTGARRLAVDAPSECGAEVVGPGGAVLASVTGCPERAATVAVPVVSVPVESGGDEGWIALGIGAGVAAVAVAVVLAVVLTQPSGEVGVQSVVVRW